MLIAIVELYGIGSMYSVLYGSIQAKPLRVKGRKIVMELIDEESLKPFISLMDVYEQSFSMRSIDDFRSLHVTDDRVVF